MSTPAEELRAAAKTLREAIKNATPGPWQANDDFGVVALRTTWPHGFDDAHEWVIDDGVLENDGDAAWIGLIHPGLAEPLAAWLESAVSVYLTHPVNDDYMDEHGHRWCDECNDEECGGLAQVDKALAVARAINGGPPTVWDDSTPPGGQVCAAEVRPGRICGMPVESEPCPDHGGAQ